MLPRIDRYEITNEIGHGGMATVYRARDTRLDRWVAVKVMHPHLRGTEQARARFAREARAVARLRHPSILEIYDYSGHDSENAYIATELLSGPTLRDFFDQVGEVPPEIVACIGAELAAALAAAHAQGIVHRDVKPENVLLHESRTVKLTDFGIADMLDPSMSAMTATGQLLGSPAHMAPEQVETGDSDARSDIFALGTILYLLATGALPFSGKNPHQVLKRVVDCAPVDPLTLRPALGRPLCDVISRCLAKSPAARFQTASELEEALLKLLTAVGVDDPRAALEAYLRDPAGESPRMQERVHAALLASARTAVAARDRPRAIDLLDRVLAQRDGDSEALKLLAQLDRAGRMRVAGRASLMVAALLGVGALWYASAPKTGAISSPPAAKTTATPHAPRTEPAVVPREEPPTGTTAKPAEDASQEVSKAAEPAEPRPARPREIKPRTVTFDPQPANVTISIDGADPRPFGPSFRMAELAPGMHRFQFVGAHGCCKERTIDIEIPPGPGETVVSARLEFRDARLYVVSNVHADVVLDDGQLAGRTRSLLAVPMKRRQDEQHRISVTAPGHKPYTGFVQLRAGDVTQLEISLEPSDPR